MEIINGVISWTHGISASLSLIFGAIVLFGNKGDAKHRKIGEWYFYAMLVNNLTALVIMNVFGKCFFPHYLAIACLATIIPGIIAAKRKYKHWLIVHIACMVISYYFLIGGAINETFLHIPSLRPYIINGEPIVGIVHSIAMTLFIFLLIYYLRKYKKTKPA